MTSSPVLGHRAPVQPDRLRLAMRQHGAGVAVITTRDAGSPTGFCASSLISVSLEPPTVCFTVATGSTSGRVWARHRHGLVHLLRSDQQALAAGFARSGADKFAGVAWHWGPEAQPLLDNVLAWMLVSTRTRVVVGDHLLLVCDVREVEIPPRPQPAPGPLLHHDGAFYALSPVLPS